MALRDGYVLDQVSAAIRAGYDLDQTSGALRAGYDAFFRGAEEPALAFGFTVGAGADPSDFTTWWNTRNPPVGMLLPGSDTPMLPGGPLVDQMRYDARPAHRYVILNRSVGMSLTDWADAHVDRVIQMDVPNVRNLLNQRVGDYHGGGSGWIRWQLPATAQAIINVNVLVGAEIHFRISE